MHWVKERPPPADFHLPGKHNQKTHGHGGVSESPRKEGGFTHLGVETSVMGKMGELLLVKNQKAAGIEDKFGRVRHTQKRGGGQHPVDVRSDTHGIEVKTINSKNKRLNCAIPDADARRKEAFVKGEGIKGAVVLQVLDVETGVMHVYAYDKGFRRGGVGTTGSFEIGAAMSGLKRLGEYPVTQEQIDTTVERIERDGLNKASVWRGVVVAAAHHTPVEAGDQDAFGYVYQPGDTVLEAEFVNGEWVAWIGEVPRDVVTADSYLDGLTRNFHLPGQHDQKTHGRGGGGAGHGSGEVSEAPRQKFARGEEAGSDTPRGQAMKKLGEERGITDPGEMEDAFRALPEAERKKRYNEASRQRRADRMGVKPPPAPPAPPKATRPGRSASKRAGTPWNKDTGFGIVAKGDIKEGYDPVLGGSTYTVKVDGREITLVNPMGGANEHQRLLMLDAAARAQRSWPLSDDSPIIIKVGMTRGSGLRNAAGYVWSNDVMANKHVLTVTKHGLDGSGSKTVTYGLGPAGVVVHEMGHVAHGGNNPSDYSIARTDRAERGARAISQYAGKNRVEQVAEGFAAHVFSGEDAPPKVQEMAERYGWEEPGLGGNAVAEAGAAAVAARASRADYNRRMRERRAEYRRTYPSWQIPTEGE